MNVNELHKWMKEQNCTLAEQITHLTAHAEKLEDELACRQIGIKTLNGDLGHMHERCVSLAAHIDGVMRTAHSGAMNNGERRVLWEPLRDARDAAYEVLKSVPGWRAPQ